MIIACPNCGAALELPEESVGAKVQCPVCETAFVSTGPEEWKTQTKQRLSKVLQTFSADELKTIDGIMFGLACRRFDEAQFRMLEIEDIIKSPLGFMLVIDCATSSPAALAYTMSHGKSKFSVWRDVPGRRGVGLLFENRDYERNDDESANFEDIRKREEWQRLSSDGLALPVLLGVDFLNRDLVLNMADFNCLYVTGGDTCAQSRRMDTIVNGILACRDITQVRLFELDFMDAGDILFLPKEYYWERCEEHLAERNNKNWKREAKKYIDMIKAEKRKREQLFERAGCDCYETYREKHVLPHVVIFVQIEGREFCKKDNDLFTEMINLIYDLKNYGMHLILIDYSPYSLESDAFPFYLHNCNGVGFLSGHQSDYLMSLVAFGSSGAMHAHGDYHPVYKSPNGEVCKFRLAKFRE